MLPIVITYHENQCDDDKHTRISISYFLNKVFFSSYRKPGRLKNKPINVRIARHRLSYRLRNARIVVNIISDFLFIYKVRQYYNTI